MEQAKQPLLQSLDSSPSLEHPPCSARSGRRKRKQKQQSGQKKVCKAGGYKGKGKRERIAEETASELGAPLTHNHLPRLPHELGPSLLLPYHVAPTEFFTQVYPTELIDLIVEQTNLYAEQ